jgi:hypothetical protein
MDLDLDTELTMVTFNNKNFDVTDIRDTLIRRSSLFRTLFEECDGNVIINTDLIDHNLFKKVIDYIVKDRNITFEKIKDVNIALNYFGIDRELVENYHTKLKRDIRKLRLTKDELLSLIRINKENRLTRIEDLLYGDYDINEYCQLFEDLTEDIEYNEFAEIYDIWSKRVNLCEIVIDMRGERYKIEQNIIDFVPRYNRDSSLLDIHKYTRYMKYHPSKDPHTHVPCEFKDGDDVILSKELTLAKFHESAYGILEDLSFENLVVAGGYALYSISPHLKRGTSDVDIFIYGNDAERETAFNRTLDHFQKYGKDNNKRVFWTRQYQAVTLCIDDIDINFQIIVTHKRYKTQILDGFHLDYVQAMFDGQSFLCNSKLIRSLRSQTIYTPFREKLKPYMYYKAYKKGFSFDEDYKYDMNILDNDEEVKKKIESYYYPNSEESAKDIILSIQKKFKNHIGQVSQIFTLDQSRPKSYEISFSTEKYGAISFDPEEIRDNIYLSCARPHGFTPNRYYTRNILYTNRPVFITLPSLTGYYNGKNRIVMKLNKDRDREIIDYLISFEKNVKETFESVIEVPDDLLTTMQNTEMNKAIYVDEEDDKSLCFGVIGIDPFKFESDTLTFPPNDIRAANHGWSVFSEWKDKDDFEFTGEVTVTPAMIWVREDGTHGIKYKIVLINEVTETTPIEPDIVIEP